MVKRLFVQKREGFDIEAKDIFNDLRENLGIKRFRRFKNT